MAPTDTAHAVLRSAEGATGTGTGTTPSSGTAPATGTGTTPSSGTASAPPAPARARTVQRACPKRGLLVELAGPQGPVVRLMPPLTLTGRQAEAVLDRRTDAVDASVRTSPRAGAAPTACATCPTHPPRTAAP